AVLLRRRNFRLDAERRLGIFRAASRALAGAAHSGAESAIGVALRPIAGAFFAALQFAARIARLAAVAIALRFLGGIHHLLLRGRNLRRILRSRFHLLKLLLHLLRRLTELTRLLTLLLLRLALR